MDLTSDYVGLTLEEAKALAGERGLLFRIGVMDGKPSMSTADFVPGRITAIVENGIVISCRKENSFSGIAPEILESLLSNRQSRE